MQIKIQNGVVDLSGEPILKNINIEINTESKIGIVGRNGCGKTTLLRLLSGELMISRDDPSVSSCHIVSGKPVIGTLSQLAFKDNSVKMVDEIRSAYSDILTMKSELSSLQSEMETNPTPDNIQSYTTLLDRFTSSGGFYFEKEYEAAIKKFGFTKEDKEKPLSDFSGGQRTKIAFLKLLLSKPDLLLLDEPTNHLDVEAVSWLEEYLSNYKKAVVIVSHDRMFLDHTVNTVYEIERGKTYKYDGNYTSFVQQKKSVREQQLKDYEAQQKEIERLNELIERFRYKATKAAMVQSKIKQLEKMDIIEPPESYDSKQFHTNFQPDLRSAKDVLNVRDLKIGYENVITELSFNVLRGQHIGIIGGNGKGKSTLLKTIVGAIPSLGGAFTVGNNVRIGYFDQQMAQYTSDKTVFDDFLDEFPTLDNFQARSALGAFLFSGDDVFKNVNMLSGGEKVRLALCKLFKKKPNFLILDEPTNHMDIVGKETLESMLADFEGTILFVSHDRYFVKKVADSLLVFDENATAWYEFGYDEYIEKAESKSASQTEATDSPALVKQKKAYTTPGKEKSRRERALKKAESTVTELEIRLEQLNDEIKKEENISDFIKLTQLQSEIEETEELLLQAMDEWEKSAELFAQLIE